MRFSSLAMLAAAGLAAADLAIVPKLKSIEEYVVKMDNIAAPWNGMLVTALPLVLPAGLTGANLLRNINDATKLAKAGPSYTPEEADEVIKALGLTHRHVDKIAEHAIATIPKVLAFGTVLSDVGALGVSIVLNLVTDLYVSILVKLPADKQTVVQKYLDENRETCDRVGKAFVV